MTYVYSEELRAEVKPAGKESLSTSERMFV